MLGQRRLESLEEAAEVYFAVLMPERDATVTLTLISQGADASEASPPAPKPVKDPRPGRHARRSGGTQTGDLTARYAALAAGMLLGSPEFQVK